MIMSMLWYLLSPIRGTATPPRLPASHPVRRAFYRHGKTTAQHWLIAMLISVAIAMGFSYPTVFLAGNPTAGLTAYPPTFWTTAKPIEDSLAKADIEMRQIWIHGSHMRALEKNVLKQGLEFQQRLLGDDVLSKTVPALNEKLNWSTWTWGYHSPLMYWNNSALAIDTDENLLETINGQKHALSSLNIVLRPASVFAGKRFDGQYLQAADALVISLINKVNAGSGKIWENAMRAVTYEVCPSCTFFPYDGHLTRRRVFEFGFTPLSMQEHIALTFAYSCMAVYVLLSLRKMKAFHSRFGLVVTAVTQMTCSILASFTICNILKINLSMIPQNAYPFVVLLIGMENMFRLINAVLSYPPTMATELRIANALGSVGPLSVATAAQNLVILALLSTVVSPGVAAFCSFAAIATLFDVFFLLTFFVAVLNVDIRRLELQDALTARQNQPKRRRGPSPSRWPWFDALIQGRLPFSTRMAGTAVTTTFILFLNYHFFEHKTRTPSIQNLLGSIRDKTLGPAEGNMSSQPPMNAIVTADEWLQMQDIDTAREILQLAKPGADTFVIRIFEPLVVVLPGSDRTEALRSPDQWTQALRAYAIHHFYPVAVAIVFIVAFVAILMNILLYNEAGDDDNEIDLEETEDALVVQTLELPHRLDVVKMASNENGHFVTVGLDRTVAIAIADRARQSYQMVSVPSRALKPMCWPIRNLAIDDSGEWLACHWADDSVTLYECMSGVTMNKLLDYPDDNPAVLFEFVTLPLPAGSKLHLAILTSGGRLAMTSVDEPKSGHIELSQTPLVGAAFVSNTGAGRRLITVTDAAKVIAWSCVDGTWTPTTFTRLQIPAPLDRLTSRASIEMYSEHGAGLLLITTSNAAIFLESNTLAHEASLNLQDFADSDLAVDGILVSPPRKCPVCSGIGWRKLAVSREVPARDTHDFTTWSVDSDDDSCICLSQASDRCPTFETLRKEKHEIRAPGAWRTVKSQAVLGIRKQSPQHSGLLGSKNKALSPLSLRQRRRTRQVPQADMHQDHWEAYKLSVDGEMITVDVSIESEPTHDSDDKDLYVNSAGPMVPLDAQAVAVAFGNTVKVIRASRRTSVSHHSGGAIQERRSSVSTRRDAASKREQ